MIKSVIFDCGNVLNAFQPISYYQQLGYQKEDCEKVCRALFQSKEWKQYDQGLLSLEKVMEIIVEQYPDDVQLIQAFASKWLGVLKMISAHQVLVDDLKKQGYQVYLLSNIAKEPWDYVNQLGNYEERFDGWVLSYQEQVCKPNQKIYEVLIDRYHLNPCECLFLDDLEANVDQAICLGMNSIVIKNEDMREQVWKVIKEVNDREE